MASNNLDPQMLTTTMMKAIQETFSKMSSIPSSSEPEIKEIDIVEYDERMRVSGMDKFSAPAYISAFNYYLSSKDIERHKAKGAVVLYMDFENAGKFFKTLGFAVPEDEDDASMLEACGKVCEVLATAFKNALIAAGYLELVMDGPYNYKNSAIDGVEFSLDQKTKHEFSFFYFKKKAIVVELTLAAIPLKG